MQVIVRKWGDGLGIKLPKDISEKFDLKDGKQVDININQILENKVKSNSNELQILLDKITPENNHNEIDFGGNIGNESW